MCASFVRLCTFDEIHCVLLDLWLLLFHEHSVCSFLDLCEAAIDSQVYVCSFDLATESVEGIT